MAKKNKKENKSKIIEGSVVSDQLIDDVSSDSRVQLMQADFERQAALNEAGQEEEVYGFWGKLYKAYNWYHAKTTGFRVKKKTYLILLLLTGWAGGHRWYQGRRYLGLFETLFCWTGLPLIMTVTDFMEVFPIKPDEDGYITL